jgi:hypothetical protein
MSMFYKGFTTCVRYVMSANTKTSVVNPEATLIRIFLNVVEKHKRLESRIKHPNSSKEQQYRIKAFQCDWSKFQTCKNA